MPKLHCYSDGKAVLMETTPHGDAAVGVFPYEAGMRLIVRAELPNKMKRFKTVEIPAMAVGESRQLVDITAAGPGAQIIAFERAMPIAKKRIRKPKAAPTAAGDVSGVASKDGTTPAELWASGIKNVPTPVPDGNVAFLPMMAEYYDSIECGEKRVEYRSDCQKYNTMLGLKKPVAVRLQYGYTKRQMIWQVAKIDYQPGEGYDIYLGKRLS